MIKKQSGKKLKSKAPKQEEPALDIEPEEQEEFQDFEEPPIDEDEAIAALVNKGKDKNETRQQVQKIMDFKFRTIDLIQIYLKKSKDPSLFLKHVGPLVATIKAHEKDKVKEAFVNKICAIVKSYASKQQNFELQYSEDLENCITEVIFVAKKIQNKKIHKVLKYILKCLLSIVFKAELKYPINGLVTKFKEAFESWLFKSKIELDSDYFKELFSKYKVIGHELIESLIKGIAFKEHGGAKKDNRRNDAINLFVSLLNTVGEKHNDLAKALLNQQDKILELVENVYGHTELIKDNKNAAIHKYHTIFLGILKTVSAAVKEEGSDKAKLKTFIKTYKVKLTKKIEELNGIEGFKDNEKAKEKVTKMVEEIKSA